MFRSQLGAFPARMLALAATTLVATSLVAAACASPSSSAGVVPTQLALGTWGSDGAGIIVGDSLVHVHIGCTKGDFPRPSVLDSGGRFDVAGSYVLRAYPIEIGPALPARFTGVARGNRLTLTVAVDDTVEHKLVILGPTVITFGRNPKLGPCPICAKPERKR